MDNSGGMAQRRCVGTLNVTCEGAEIELLLTGELVGRTPPFSIKHEDYRAPRKGY